MVEVEVPHVIVHECLIEIDIRLSLFFTFFPFEQPQSGKEDIQINRVSILFETMVGST